MAALIRSIQQYAPSFEYEIIAVDNASHDFDERSFRADFPDVKLIANTENLGYAKGNNQAFEIASGDFVLLMNPDTRVTEGAISALVEFMESHTDACAAGAKLLRPDGKIDKSVRGFPYPGAIAWEFMGFSRLFPRSKKFGAYRMTYFDYNEIAEVDQPMGSCLILSGIALKEIGPFDERFPIFFNEVDWLYRAKQAGYKTYFLPQAVVIHEGAASTKQVKRRRMVNESHDSLIRFYEKHFKGRIAAPLYYFTIVCITLGRYLRG